MYSHSEVNESVCTCYKGVFVCEGLLNVDAAEGFPLSFSVPFYMRTLLHMCLCECGSVCLREKLPVAVHG